MNDEELLSDYVDGRLAPAAKAAFEARLKASPALARRARTLKAMKSALAGSAPKMPADLKAALKRDARAADARRRRSPSWLDSLRASFSAPWAYGAGAAAFAAAAVTLALHHPAQTVRTPQVSPAPGSSAAFSDPAAAQGLQSLWSDDNGRDNDES
jgi:anti-sigma factor RsiW